jgi:hypothetical protein
MAAIPRRVTCHVGRAACERGPGGPTASGVTLPALLATGMALRQAADHGHAAGGPLILAPGDGQSRASRHPPGARRRARTPHHPPGHETGAAPRGLVTAGDRPTPACRRSTRPASGGCGLIQRPRRPVQAPPRSRPVDRRSRGVACRAPDRVPDRACGARVGHAASDGRALAGRDS